ncbi:Putative AMP-dependent synthetase/ligase, AMP-binding, AMP-binding enzyme domain, ANL [Septoria linicola]|uniref:AMP-dependent synthetase/ligase, AMP-binding, AMP-binding enzyme domain, ANL n=1 Tax=Septoria linicola TaxID=215465 RepID=A0A9Q9AKU1_9PEZI|nr:putative AMP-dependent synthetase/ligase, AMP-binding, AMP-binding enzyme domain, ANL [Septoria linicola]USW48265.1 Putative AMP-dependent synthetase/ligase, AMP-binding, AMP-binding enzyme domain, ANL [Septoria linicola]
MPPTWPSVQAIFRKLERISVNSSSTYEREPGAIAKDEVLPLSTLMREPWRMSAFNDRTLSVPPHTGRYVLPCHPLFARLVRSAHETPPRLCVRDDNTGVEATHLQLLTDVLSFRERLRQSLSSDTLKALDERQEVYLAILAPGGYEFTVAILAALALGAAVVPMTTALPPEEALYFVSKSRAAAILVADGAIRLGTSVEKLVKDRDARSTFQCIPVAPSLVNVPLAPREILVSSDTYLDDNAPGVVIFTSGTTGAPKGAVMRRAFIHDEAMGVIDHYSITKHDVLLHLLPVHHATGIGIMFFPFLLAGALLEFKSGSFDSEWLWERWRQGGTTFFSGVPTIYMRMMRHFQQSIAARPDVQQYVDGARNVRACICGTSALPKNIADFWATLLGRQILLRYGMTETGAVFKVRMGDQNVPDGSVGNIAPGCDVILSEGDHGEILAKSPGMFSHFLFDPEATAASHDARGYYRTGDIARKEGDYYRILGRASVDIIKTGGYKISALDIERELLSLPYVAEAMVVGVPDEEFGERIAAALVLKSIADSPSEVAKTAMEDVTLEKLREDLRSRLAGYKLPTVMRIIQEELPKSATGKVVKKVLGPQFFPPESYSTSPIIQVWKLGGKSKL